RMRGEYVQGARVRHAPGKKGSELAPALCQIGPGPGVARRGQQHGHQREAGVLACRERRRERLGLQALAVLLEDCLDFHYWRRVSRTPASCMTLPPTTVSTERI